MGQCLITGCGRIKCTCLHIYSHCVFFPCTGLCVPACTDAQIGSHRTHVGFYIFFSYNNHSCVCYFYQIIIQIFHRELAVWQTRAWVFFLIRVTSLFNCATESWIVTPRKNISVPERLPTLIINRDNLFPPPPHPLFFLFFLQDVVTDFYFQPFVPQWHDQSGEYRTVMKLSS